MKLVLFDIAAGNENGARTIGVATGKNSLDELLAAKPAMAIEDLLKSSAICKALKLPVSEEQ
jgi:phosphoglycolate phosphatase-like HAD superfamily hydrolase